MHDFKLKMQTLILTISIIFTVNKLQSQLINAHSYSICGKDEIDSMKAPGTRMAVLLPTTDSLCVDPDSAPAASPRSAARPPAVGGADPRTCAAWRAADRNRAQDTQSARVTHRHSRGFTGTDFQYLHYTFE